MTLIFTKYAIKLKKIPKYAYINSYHKQLSHIKKTTKLHIKSFLAFLILIYVFLSIKFSNICTSFGRKRHTLMAQGGINVKFDPVHMELIKNRSSKSLFSLTAHVEVGIVNSFNVQHVNELR